MEQQMVLSIIFDRVVLGDGVAPAAYIVIPLAILAVVGIMVGTVVLISTLVINGIKKQITKSKRKDKMINSLLLMFSAWLPGRLVYGDIPSFPLEAVLSLGTVVAVSAVIVVIIVVVVLVIRKTRPGSAKKEKPVQK